VLLSAAAQEMVRDQLPAEAALMDLGERRLKDLFRPERVFQLNASGLPSEFPPLRTLESHPNNLPLQPTPLVGREREVEEVVERLRSEEVRLLTLAGAGGVGKTRLALQAAADLLDEFDDGVFFVSLATITDPALVPSAIAGSLGVKERAHQPLIEGLKNDLHQKHLLLVLDNCEQVPEGAPVVGELIAACSKLKILATSRIPLRLYGEQEYPVPPLALPDPRVLPPLRVLTQYEAVKLFVERARAVKPEFEVTNDSAPAVAEICARLDGLPLAIELAAARVRVLPPQKMLQRLSNRLKLLKGGPRDLPTRQQTLRGTIDWSYDLLEEDEKTLFGRLSAFAGGRTLEAIEEICDPEGDLVDVLEGVESLLEKSLLRQEEGVGGEPRFLMLETVHEYAREKLQESDEAEPIKHAHAEYFLVLAEEAEPRLWESGDKAWFDRLEAEHDNMRAALSWTIEHEEAELALRLGGALRWFWSARGYYGEGRRWLEQALSEEGRTSAGARAKALAGVGLLASEQSDIDRAEAAAQEGLKLSEEAGIRGVIAADFKDILGEAALLRGDHERASELFEEGLVLYREARNTKGVAWSVCSLAAVSSDRGDYEREKQLYEEGIALSREIGGARMLADMLISLGYTYLLEGDHERATALNEEAAELCRKRGYRGGLQYALDNLGWVALLREDHERAKALHEESLVLCKEIGDKEIGSESLEGLACSAASGGEAQRAARLFGAAQALREAAGYHQRPRERSLREPYLTIARSGSDEGAWETAFAEGQGMSFEEAVEYALSTEELSPAAPPAPERPSTGGQQADLTRR
jgi:predicted ATPase